ncbi:MULTISPECIES: VOC family protein [Pseudoalteromonas]|uniref:VOC family protein n=1 Tax=Pseudoalteromonas TaxID=53246 RepID=UPI00215CB600|nr:MULTISPECIES: VOC family protein [Pseudoalteromonas]MDI4651864.1 VOC family protein [Pseudoalteromonas shioyasakiensis]
MKLLTPLRAAILMAVTAVSLTGCQLTSSELPAISDSGTKNSGHVVWHDLITPNLAQSQTFYGSVFGWQFEAVNDSYTLASLDGKLIAGMAELDNKQNASHWLSLISSKDIAAVSEKTIAAGGKVLVSSTEIKGRGTIAVLEDPQGAVFSLINTVNGDPETQQTDNGWIWQEVWSDNPEQSKAFYQSLGNYSAQSKPLKNGNYSYLALNGTPAIGFVKKPDAEIGNTWVNYIKVADVDATLLKVTAAGGIVLMAPNDKVRSGSVAIIRDPAGAGIVIQEQM